MRSVYRIDAASDEGGSKRIDRRRYLACLTIIWYDAPRLTALIEQRRYAGRDYTLQSHGLLTAMMIVLAWVHVLAAVVWLGGMVFLSVVLMPVFRRGTFGADRRILFQALVRRFRIIVWIMICLLVLSGPLLISSRTGTLEEPEAWRSVLHLKLWLVAGLVLLTAVHDVWLGPLVGRLRREASEMPSPADLLLIRVAAVVVRLGLLLGVVVLFLAVALART
jgi:copper resistance protein D